MAFINKGCYMTMTMTMTTLLLNINTGYKLEYTYNMIYYL